MKRFATLVEDKSGQQFLAFLDEMNPMDDLEEGQTTLRFVSYYRGRPITMTLPIRMDETNGDMPFRVLGQDEQLTFADAVRQILIDSNPLTKLLEQIDLS